MSKEKGVNVLVLLRCRPFSEDELRNNALQVVTCNEYQREVAVSQNIAGKHIHRVFTFDKVFGPLAQQRDLYDQAVVPIVHEVLEGFNCTIFAYGQSGTGKTYTMEGECKRSKSGPNGELPQEAGVIPRAVKQIFDTLEGQNAEYSVSVTFLELYNEEITDLLAPEEITRVPVDDRQKKQLPLMEDGKGGVLVRGLEVEIVTSASEIFTLLERGFAKRHTAETLLNKQSSQSHSLFSITIHIKEATPEGEELIKCGKLNLVDLAGSENISRSGAREGRAREAGEINKSLLTLGRVINALVEHLGHIPYRDSKLTRLLRDSLGGRAKTCIIATVSPAVHSLEETLSTLDYAHRAKNIRNKPEVVYIPKERYYQEESEKKAMTDQTEQVGVAIDIHQKQLEELQEKYDAQVQECCGLTSELGATKRNLNQTSKLLAGTEEELRRCQYALKEHDFVISQAGVLRSDLQRNLYQASKLLAGTEEELRRCQYALKECDFVIFQAGVLRSDLLRDLYQTSKLLAGTEEELRRCQYALKERDFVISEHTNAARVLRSDLEKSLQDNALLHSKIAREDKLNVDNRSVANDFQSNLVQQLGSLSNTVATSMSLSFLDTHNKAIMDLKKKMTASGALYKSHFEAVQNLVRVQCLEEISASISLNASSIGQVLAAEAVKANSIFEDLQSTLSTHQGEMAHFARDLRQRFNASMEHSKNISEFTNGFLHKLMEESGKLQSHVTSIDDIQTRSIVEFQKAYEEQSKSDAEKLIADVEKLIADVTGLVSNHICSLVSNHICSLVSNHIRSQKDLVDARLNRLKETVVGNKTFLDGHVSSMEGITTDAKRKWQELYVQADNDAKDSADFSAAKHCRMGNSTPPATVTSAGGASWKLLNFENVSTPQTQN